MPAQVVFHTGVADPVHFSCRLLRKASRQGVPVLVTAPADTLAALDTALWTFDAQDFVAHVRLPASPAVLARTLIWLCGGEVPPAAPRVWVNIGADAPQDPSHVDRVIEIVGDSPDERRAARERWRHYEGWGVKPEHHPAAG